MACKIIEIDKEITAIVCGDPSDHECNEDGRILLLSNGERIKDTENNRKKYFHETIGGSVCCTICGHAAIDDVYKLNF